MKPRSTKPLKPLPAFDRDETRRKRESYVRRFKEILEKATPKGEPLPPVFEPSKYGDGED